MHWHIQLSVNIEPSSVDPAQWTPAFTSFKLRSALNLIIFKNPFLIRNEYLPLQLEDVWPGFDFPETCLQPLPHGMSLYPSWLICRNLQRSVWKQHATSPQKSHHPWAINTCIKTHLPGGNTSAYQKEPEKYSGPSILRPPVRPWKCGLILQVFLKQRFHSTQSHTLGPKSMVL